MNSAPVKIECRNCLGDGWVIKGRGSKDRCPACDGRGTNWIDRTKLLPTDVVCRR